MTRAMPAKRNSWLAMADFLANEAGALKSDPRFAAEVRSVAHRLAIPSPAAVVTDRTCSAVARRCSDLVAAGELRQAFALLAGHRLAIVRWSWRKVEELVVVAAGPPQPRDAR